MPPFALRGRVSILANDLLGVLRSGFGELGEGRGRLSVDNGVKLANMTVANSALLGGEVLNNGLLGLDDIVEAGRVLIRLLGNVNRLLGSLDLGGFKSSLLKRRRLSLSIEIVRDDRLLNNILRNMPLFFGDRLRFLKLFNRSDFVLLSYFRVGIFNNFGLLRILPDSFRLGSRFRLGLDLGLKLFSWSGFSDRGSFRLGHSRLGRRLRFGLRFTLGSLLQFLLGLLDSEILELISQF